MIGVKKNANGLTQMDLVFLDAYKRKGSGRSAMMEMKPHWTPAAAEAESRRYLLKPAVQAALARIEKKAQDKTGCTLEEHLRTLATLRNIAVQKGQMRAAINAEELRGKAAGLYRIDITLRRLTMDLAATVHLGSFTDEELTAIRTGNVTEDLIERLAIAAPVDPSAN